MFFYLRWSCHHLDINIETMAPEELDKVLSKFYADVKKKNGNDCEPESLKLMQSSTDEILIVKAISQHQQGRLKQPKKSQPLTPDEESALWEKVSLATSMAKS